MIGSTNIGSVRMSYRDVRHLLCSIFVGKTACQKILFQILSQKNRSDCESQKSGFGFDPKNPPWVWILWIDDPFLNLPQKTQVSVLGFVEIRICFFPPKTQGFVYHVCPGLLVEPIIRPLIRSGTWEITLNDKIMTSITSNVTNNKKEIWKTVRLTKHKFYSKTTISIRCCLLQVSLPCILLHFSSAIYTFFSCCEQIFLSLTQFCGGSHCFVNFMTQLPKPLVIAGMTHCFEMGLNL